MLGGGASQGCDLSLELGNLAGQFVDLFAELAVLVDNDFVPAMKM